MLPVRFSQLATHPASPLCTKNENGGRFPFDVSHTIPESARIYSLQREASLDADRTPCKVLAQLFSKNPDARQALTLEQVLRNNAL
jgi:hypothetical protein